MTWNNQHNCILNCNLYYWLNNNIQLLEINKNSFHFPVWSTIVAFLGQAMGHQSSGVNATRLRRHKGIVALNALLLYEFIVHHVSFSALICHATVTMLRDLNSNRHCIIFTSRSQSIYCRWLKPFYWNLFCIRGRYVERLWHELTLFYMINLNLSYKIKLFLISFTRIIFISVLLKMGIK